MRNIVKLAKRRSTDNCRHARWNFFHRPGTSTVSRPSTTATSSTSPPRARTQERTSANPASFQGESEATAFCSSAAFCTLGDPGADARCPGEKEDASPPSAPGGSGATEADPNSALSNPTPEGVAVLFGGSENAREFLSPPLLGLRACSAIIRSTSSSFAAWYWSSLSTTLFFASAALSLSRGFASSSSFRPFTNDTNSTASARFTAKNDPRMIIATK